MYIPSSFAEDDLPTLHAFIEAHPLAALVTHSETDGLFATHLPLVLDRTAGPMGTLIGHVARANPHSRGAAGESRSAMIIFTGPDAYITPEWYAAKRDTGRVVPTWNYVAVHVYGALHLRDDPEFLREHLETLTTRHESNRPHPWQVSDAPADYVQQQVKAIVGVEISIARIEGKWKMSQNRSEADVHGVIQGLIATEGAQNRTVAETMRRSQARSDTSEER
jgi:transcriptional regulator